MSTESSPTDTASFRHFFFRGLGILLPTVLTIWLVVIAYTFVDTKIARHINTGVRLLILQTSPWPTPTEDDFAHISNKLDKGTLSSDERLTSPHALKVESEWASMKAELGTGVDEGEARMRFVRDNLTFEARRYHLQNWWNRWKIGEWPVLNLVGLFIALFLIYLIGRLLGGYIGRRLYEQGERMLLRVPVFKQVYPYVKQVTDFFVGDKDDKLQFSKVVAVQYPRKGLWSLGLMTGETMRSIQNAAAANCYTVFIPSSPTPFTGYVITVPAEDTIDLAISIDDALRFCVSGGVIVPDSQMITEGGVSAASGDAAAEDAGETAAKSG